MDGHEWAACRDPDVLLKWLQRSKRCQVSPRKLRLFSCACCRRLWRKKEAVARAAIELAEAFADGLAKEQAVEDCRRATNGDGAVAWALWLPSMTYLDVTRGESAARSAAGYARMGLRTEAAEAAAQCDLLRDIVLHPFEPPSSIERTWLGANDAAALELAETIYQERDFRALPVLADALKEAGCEDKRLLAHCRSKGPHVRGCWALDLLLGKN